MTSVGVPVEVYDDAVLLMALWHQRLGLEVERQSVADAYTSSMTAMLSDGRIDELIGAMKGFRMAWGPGWSKITDAAGLPKLNVITGMARGLCNDGEGRWRGTWPLNLGDPRPGNGTWVVYRLLTGDDLIYIGSTGSFSERLKAHARDKPFDSWQAARCETERECRDLEGALIDRYRPPLNRMIPTPKLVLA